MNMSEDSISCLDFQIQNLTHTLINPYNQNDWICIGSSIVYGFGLIGVGLISTVIWYESSGRVTSYRTVTNQLMSCTLIEVQ